MKTHAIHWKSLVNGKVGVGTLLFEKEEAERLAEELNEDYPEIHHVAMPGTPVPVEAVNLQPGLDYHPQPAAPVSDPARS
jgi:hypothetical protein